MRRRLQPYVTGAVTARNAHPPRRFYRRVSVRVGLLGLHRVGRTDARAAG